MKRILQMSLAAAVAMVLTAGAQAEEAKSTFKVKDMMCGSCESAVKDAVTKVDGVKSIQADAEKGEAVVAYDPAKTTPAKITAAINTTKFKVVEDKK
jgi:copper chaperone CopZ